MALVQISDVIVPQIFTPYVQQLTEEKSNLVKSGVLVRDAYVDSLIAGGGLTFNLPSWKDLGDTTDNISTDDAVGGNDSTPNKTSTSNEIAVRLSRNNSWSAADLSASLAGEDPMASIGSRVADYWVRRLQAAFVATVTGIFAQNHTTTDSTHTQDDMLNDVSASGFTDGVTNFTTEAFIDTAVTMGDSLEELIMVMVHSVVYARMQKNNLIDFIPDSRGETNIPTFLGRRVVVDDGMPKTGSVYDTWLFGSGAFRFGVGAPKVPTETFRYPHAGMGGGQEVLFNRHEWVIHPVGHKYAGTAPNGGPSNANSSNNLANSGSWARVYPERKQVHMARLVTREA